MAAGLDIADRSRERTRVSPLLPYLLALVAFPVASFLTLLCVTFLTLPLGYGRTGMERRGPLRALRTAVGVLCGFLALRAALWSFESAGGRVSLAVPALLLASTATIHLLGARRFHGTIQFRDEMFTLAGELTGLIASAVVFVR